MSKLAQSTSKYTVFVRFDADGTVEKPDVIGAVFGQTEGLLGPDLELRELQRTGRIGRIDVELKTVNGKTSGLITIPSSLDSSETALIAATMETIERVGPCNAKIYVEKIEDVRISKRKYVVDRAKELLGKIFDEGVPDTQEISEKIKEAVRTSEVASYKGLPAGPNIEKYDSLIIVEGRADVLNLLRCGIKNAIAINGTSVKKPIIDIAKQKVTTVFLDGDRGGDLILKELKQKVELDFIARAPEGKEVEDLTKKEIYKTLREKVPSDQAKTEFETVKERRPFKRIPSIDTEKVGALKSVLSELTGTRAACFLDENMEIIGKVPIKEVFNTVKKLSADALVLDGIVDQKLVTLCSQNGVKVLVGTQKQPKIRFPNNIEVLTLRDL